MRNFDLFPKIDNELVSKSKSGGILTILTFATLFILVSSEIVSLIYPREKYDFMLNNIIQHNLAAYVDLSIETECEYLRTEVSDILGDQELVDMQKTKILPSGCRLKGEFQVAKVDGRISILVNTPNANLSHHFHELRFGHQYHPNPLDNTFKLALKPQVQYFIGLVPTILENDNLFGNRMVINQYSTLSTQNEKRPYGIIIKYSLEPISIKISTHRKRFVEFVTRIVGIVGGVYTSVGIVYRLLNKIKRL